MTAARKRQFERGALNSALQRADLDDLDWDAGATALLDKAVDAHRLSPRGWIRVRRVAVTIADLEESAVIAQDHVSEALAYRVT